MFHFAGSGGDPLGALNSSLQVSCQFVDWAWRVGARRKRQASSVHLLRVKDGRPSDEAHISESRYGAPGSWARTAEDGRPSDEAHISESRYGAPGSWAGATEDGLAPLDNPPFARGAKDGAPEL